MYNSDDCVKAVGDGCNVVQHVFIIVWPCYHCPRCIVKHLAAPVVICWQQLQHKSITSIPNKCATGIFYARHIHAYILCLHATKTHKSVLNTQQKDINAKPI